ncbi:MAG: sensor domain-containing diguanylate cyclase, partial [Chromatiaceae bacterium]
MSTIDPMAERTRFLYNGLTASLPISLLAGVVLAWVHWGLVSPALILGWLSLLAGATALRATQLLSFRRAERQGQGHGRVWLSRFRGGALTMGLAWAVGAGVLSQSGDTQAQFFLAFAMAGISAGVMIALATDRVSALLIVGPMLLILGLALVLPGDGLTPMAGAIVLLFLLFITLMSGRIQTSFEDNFRLRQQAESQRGVIRNNELRWRFALEGSGQGLWDWDMISGQVYYAPRWARMLGHESAELEPVLRSREERIHPDDRMRVHATLNAHLRDETSLFEAEYRMRHRDGHHVWVHDRGQVIERTSSGKPIRLIGIQEDISDRKRVEHSLHEERQLFATGPVALFIWESVDDGRVLYASENVQDLLGYTREELTSPEFNYADLIHPEDVARVLNEHHDHALSKVRQFEQSYRLRHRGGHYRWFYDITRPERDEAGRIRRIRGYLFDQTRLKETEEALAHSERQNRALLEAMPDLVLRFNSEGRYLDWHSGNTALLYAQPDRFIGKTLSQVLPDQAAWSLYEGIHSVLLHGRMRRVEYSLDIGSATHYFEARLVKLNDSEVVAVVRDVTTQKQAAERANQLAYCDTLTQLPNRRLLMENIRHAMASGQRSGQHGALLFLDLDHFKALNDTYGHAVGDLLLQQVAGRLREAVREADTVARLGGDEFVVMLEDLELVEEEALQQARQVGQKILDALGQPYDLDGMEYHCTPSIGISLFHGRRLDVEELMRRADQAMYQVKKTGRNGMHVFHASTTRLLQFPT